MERLVVIFAYIFLFWHHWYDLVVIYVLHNKLYQYVFYLIHLICGSNFIRIINMVYTCMYMYDYEKENIPVYKEKGYESEIKGPCKCHYVFPPLG